MEKDKYITQVMFRTDITKGFKGTIFAILPYDLSDSQGNITTYQHVGQHSGGDYHVCLQQSRPAKPEEYKDLFEEMTGLGYDLKVIKKRQQKKYLAEYYKSRK
mgnify:CR=1 FL=1